MKLLRFGRFLGWTILSLTATVTIAWWGWVLPIVRGSVPPWAPYFTNQEFWEAKQAALKRGWWMHDDGQITGMYGDKEWVARIIDKIERGDGYFGCENGHQDSALETLTNHLIHVQDREPTPAELKEEWQVWFRVNAGQTQEEWIRQGFAEAGFKVSLPPNKDDWPTLLRIIGAVAGPRLGVTGAPQPLYHGSLRYNSYRWLRDSGFDPMTYVLEADPTSLDGDIRGGLRGYSALDKATSMALPAGRLAFASQTNDYDGHNLSMRGFAKPESLDVVSASICGTTVTVAILLLLLLRLPQRPATT